MLSLEEKSRPHHVCWRFYKQELDWYAKVYAKTDLMNTHTESIQKLANAIKL